MKNYVKDMANWSAKNGAFVLTFLAMGGAMLLSMVKDADVNTLLPTLLGLYLGQTTSRAVSAHWAASKDATANTSEIIRDVEGIVPPPDQK